MPRFVLLVGTFVIVSTLSGCASTWDTLTSKRFRDKPFGTMFGSEDPMTVLRTNPDGEDRARAMTHLKEPAVNGKGEAEQDEALQILQTAATTDNSPWVRIAAIEALGKFQDPRAVPILTQAFYASTGISTPAPVAAGPAIEQVALNRPARMAERYGLNGPQGFPADQVMNIRGRILESLGKSQHPDAITFIGEVARGKVVSPHEEASSRNFVRQRAVASLSQMRHKDSVRVLSDVLASEHNKDLTLTNLAHNGLVNLTGQKLPADPRRWNELVQAGNFELAPEPNAIQRAIGLGSP